MTADHLSYKRATTVSLVGLAIQSVFALVFLVYSRLGADPAAFTGALAMFLGLPIWVALAVVFHQHRLERLEALEHEAYRASTAAQASVFEESGATLADEQPQARRLAALHKWFLPIVSLVVAGGYIGLGVLRFTQSRGGLSEESLFSPPPQSGWAISLGVGVAILGFIFARFVAGMAKQKVWDLLHAGSAAAVACSLIGAAQALAHFFHVATKNPVLLKWMGPAIAAGMIALGAEMALNFVLNLYRPRKAGEYPRPAFDSRVLAFIAAPDRLAQSISGAINYQFGFNVSATWFYRLLARSVASLLVLGVLTIWLLSIFTVIRPYERGLLLRNGRFVREVGPGLVIDWPWPLATVERFPASAVNELEIGTPKPSRDGPILWTNQHTTDEKFLLVRASVGADQSRAGGGSDDLSLLAVEIPIHYVVADLRKYKNMGQDGPAGRVDSIRQALLSSVASGVVIRHMATLDESQVLGEQRREVAAGIARMVQEAYDTTLDAGVQVIFAGVAGVHPEQTVAPDFEAVVSADLKRLAAVESAQADAIRSLAAVVGEVERARLINIELDRLDELRNQRAPRDAVIAQEQKINDQIVGAGGDAAVLIASARADRWQRYLGARSRAESSVGMIALYRAAPRPFRVVRFLDAIREAARNARVWVVPTEGVRIRLNQEEQVPLVTGFGSSQGQESQNK